MSRYNQFVFIGGTFPGEIESFVLKNSSGVVQNAANVLQTQLIDGFLSFKSIFVRHINLPFVGSYPKRFARVVFPSFKGRISENYSFVSLAFLNISGIKLFSRFFSVLSYLFFERASLSGSYIVVYSAHLPFVLAAAISKLFIPSCKLVIVVPDLPEFMSTDSNFLYRFFKKVETILFKSLLKIFDWFVVLTGPMISYLDLPSDRAVVIEGIVDSNFRIAHHFHEDQAKNSILYTGTLDPRYGIKHLLDAFEVSQSFHDLSLLICGAGIGEDLVRRYALHNDRIIFLGQLPRDDVRSLQQSSFLLINPRLPEGVFTRYSFPSKIMEYFAAARPVIMYKLEGIPDEYDDLYFCPTDNSIDELANCIIYVSRLASESLLDIGLRARQYVYKFKTPRNQVKKIFDLIGVDV